MTSAKRPRRRTSSRGSSRTPPHAVKNPETPLTWSPNRPARSPAVSSFRTSRGDGLRAPAHGVRPPSLGPVSNRATQRAATPLPRIPSATRPHGLLNPVAHDLAELLVQLLRRRQVTVGHEAFFRSARQPDLVERRGQRPSSRLEVRCASACVSTFLVGTTAGRLNCGAKPCAVSANAASFRFRIDLTAAFRSTPPDRLPNEKAILIASRMLQ